MSINLFEVLEGTIKTGMQGVGLSTESFNYFQSLGLAEAIIIANEKLKGSFENGTKEVFRIGVHRQDVQALFHSLAETQNAVIAFLLSLGMTAETFAHYCTLTLTDNSAASAFLSQQVDQMLTVKAEVGTKTELFPVP